MVIKDLPISPPEDDEIEICLFGPDKAYGESILVHIGEQKWVAVDSCLNSISNRPLSLEYLERFYLNRTADHITDIIVTHWDDDHIKGITELYNAATKARLAISAILTKVDSRKIMVKSHKKTNSFSEINTLYKSRKARHENPSLGNPAILRLNRDRLIQVNEGKLLKLLALSPSDSAGLESDVSLARQLWKAKGETIDYTIKATPASPNGSSVVLLIKVQEDNILLGADLEFTERSDTGWDDALQSEHLNGFIPSVFKVSHHGSENGYRKKMWDELFTKKPLYAILTPWCVGGNKLPKQEMIKNIVSHTEHAYITADPYIEKIRSADGQERVDFVPDECGIIQIRKKKGDKSKWSIKLFGSARKLSTLLD